MGTRCAIVGSGNIGTDLLKKLLKSPTLEPVLMVGIDPASDGLRRARELGVDTTAGGVDDLLADTRGAEFVFEATSAHAHEANAPRYLEAGLIALDLTPAAVGPFVVPAVNIDQLRAAPNLNLVTCGGQATVPMVAAISRAATVVYAEIVSTLASRAAGPGTRANIDEFTETTALALTRVGGAEQGKAIIILNPAEPPITMRNTVMCAVAPDSDEAAVERSVTEMVARVQRYVPGYQLKAGPVFDTGAGPGGTTKVSVFLEVTGAADYLPAFAGNLDIMTAAAVATAEALARARTEASA
jgi:acetaldehyde dehydrogenase